MAKTLIQLTKKFVSENENWYLDPYDSYTEIGMDDKQNFGGLVAALEDRGREFLITESDSFYIVKVFD